jgi:hypothetical protein
MWNKLNPQIEGTLTVKINEVVQRGSYTPMRSTELGMLQIVFLVSFESSRQGLQGRVHGLGSMMFELAVQKFLNIE